MSYEVGSTHAPTTNNALATAAAVRRAPNRSNIAEGALLSDRPAPCRRSHASTTARSLAGLGDGGSTRGACNSRSSRSIDDSVGMGDLRIALVLQHSRARAQLTNSARNSFANYRLAEPEQLGDLGVAQAVAVAHRQERARLVGARGEQLADASGSLVGDHVIERAAVLHTVADDQVELQRER